MAKRIDLPQTPRGDAEEQLRTLYSYLYQMAETLNNNLAEIGGAELTDTERRQLTEIIGDGTLPEGQLNEAETLKSLIVKTANFVQSTLTEYRLNLLGEYVADGKFGKYVRRTGLDVDVTPTGIQQNFTFQEIIQGLKTYEINAKNYIKTGLLRTVNNLPVYGVAIGKDVVTFAEDGTETYNDGNKVAELTADELSFWQNGYKVASYTGNKISFLYGGSEVMYIQNGKIYCAGDFEIQAGKTFKIVSGGVIDVDTNNFKIDSANRLMKSDKWSFTSRGCEYSNSAWKMIFGDYSTPASDVASGIYQLIQNVSTYSSEIILFTRPVNTDIYNAELSFKCSKSPNYQRYFSQLRFGGLNTPRPIIGDRNTSVSCMYLNQLIGGRIISGDQIVGSRIAILLDKDYDVTNDVFSTAGEIEISYCPDTDNGIKIVALQNGSGGSDKIMYFENSLSVPKLYYDALIQRSSKNEKHDIREMEPVGEKLDRLRPVTFVYDDDPAEKRRAGLIYEETAEVLPEICTGDESAKAISYVEMIPMLLKEIQELRARVKALEEREGGN